VRHTVADRRHVRAQQLLVRAPEFGPRIGSQFLAQPAAMGVVPGQRRRPARGGGLAAQQLRQHLLVPRQLLRQLGQRRGSLLAPPQPGETQCPGADQRTVCPDAIATQCHHGIAQVLCGPRSHDAVPQGQARLGLRQGAFVIAGPRALCTRRLVQQQRGTVHLRLVQRQPIARRCTHDQLGTHLRPEPRHQDLRRLARPLRQLLRPQPLHQPTRAAPRAQILREQRQQPAQSRRGDLPSTTGDLGQQGQLGRHPRRLASRMPDAPRDRRAMTARSAPPSRPPSPPCPGHGGPQPG
jgi:hypothetical protein